MIPEWMIWRVRKMAEQNKLDPSNVIGLVESFIDERNCNTYRSIVNKTREVIHMLKNKER